jgi:hypothetical protein
MENAHMSFLARSFLATIALARRQLGARSALLLGALAGLGTLPLGCSGLQGGAVGEGSAVFSVRVDLEPGGPSGGMGGRGPAGSAGLGGARPMGGLGGGTQAAESALPGACTPGLFYIDGLPECFVAEISTQELSCEAPGRQVLTRVREARAREAECDFRGLSTTDCALWSVCGVAKLTGSDLVSCRDGSSEGSSGFCVRDATAECPASAESTLSVVGVRPEAEALQIYCAVEDR